MSNRLSLLDASFLRLESETTPMHAGGFGLFEPGLAFADVHAALEERLELVPLARKRVRDTAMGAGRPVWVDDASFDLSYHLRHAALPAPGDRHQLGEFLSRLIGRPLDPRRPLWEVYVIEGLEGDRVCVFRKVHLAMAGGDRRDPLATLLDETPEPAAPPPSSRRWEPKRGPSNAALAVEAARERADQLGRVTSGLRDVLTHPGGLADLAASAANSALGLAGRVVGSPPASPLNGRLTPHRRYATQRVELDHLRAVRRAYGSSITDVVVAATGDAVGRLLRWRGHDTKDLDLRVMVPVRVHDELPADPEGIGESRTPGDGVVGVLVPLPVMEMDAVARLYRVMGELAGIRESRQAVGAEHLVRLAGYAPPNLHALAARVASAEARYNLAISNAPGPQEPRYLCGKQMLENYPFIPLTGDSTLSIAVSSYAGGVYFGLLGDRSAMSDVDLLAGFVSEAVDDLVAAARAANR